MRNYKIINAKKKLFICFTRQLHYSVRRYFLFANRVAIIVCAKRSNNYCTKYTYITAIYIYIYKTHA